MQQHINATTEALKAAPAVGGATVSVALDQSEKLYTFFGIPWSTLAAMLTAAYVAIQMGFFLHDRYVTWREKRAKNGD